MDLLDLDMFGQPVTSCAAPAAMPGAPAEDQDAVAHHVQAFGLYTVCPVPRSGHENRNHVSGTPMAAADRRLTRGGQDVGIGAKISGGAAAGLRAPS